MPDRDSSTPPLAGTISRITTYVITNGTKVAGVYIVLKERASPEVRESIILAGVALALGAQTVESIILTAIDRFLGGNGEKGK